MESVPGTQRQRVVIDGRYISDRYPGIGRYTFNLVAALASVAPELAIDLLVGDREQQSRFDLASLEARGVGLLPLHAPVQSIRGYFAGRRAAESNPRVIFHAPHILSAVPTTVPSVTTVHDLIPERLPEEIPSRYRRLVYRSLLRRVLASTALLLAPSQVIGSELRRRWGVDEHRITVAPYAADRGFRPVLPEVSKAVRARLGLPEQYVLYVGTDRPHKNLRRLFQAWALLGRDRRDGSSLVVAGPVDGRQWSAAPGARPRGNGEVVFLGEVDEADLAGLYGGARLAIHPALGEGFGLTVIEAMACGVAVACASTPSLDEVCGDAALRFDPTSAPAIADTIHRVLRDRALRGRLATAGLERARELSWERTALTTLAAYRRAGAARR